MFSFNIFFLEIALAKTTMLKTFSLQCIVDAADKITLPANLVAAFQTLFSCIVSLHFRPVELDW